jgi:hypothetical protein
MNDGNRFRWVGRRPRIDVGPLRGNRGDTNYAVLGDADTGRSSSVVLWCSRFGVPLWRGAIALRLRG